AIKGYKAVGRISELRKELKVFSPESVIGIAHTRWATHGMPTKENAHPHLSRDNMFAVVHNGIIENAEEIKRSLLKGDTDFASDTDTEVFVHLLVKYYKGDPVSAIANACAVLKGSYAFGILCRDFSDSIFAAASSSPLVVAQCDSGAYIASDGGAIDDTPRQAYRLLHGEICRAEASGVTFYDASGMEIKKSAEGLAFDKGDFEKGGFEHYMLKEIMEQPEAVERTVRSLVKNKTVYLPDSSIDDDFFKEDIREIVFVACGSAYHTGLVGKRIVEALCKIPCRVEIASEFRYAEPLITPQSLAVFISQSGETADTLASMRLAVHCGAQVLSIVNVQGSAMARESENVIFTRAGKEIAVATTKAYSAQLVALYSLALYVARLRGTLEAEKYDFLVNELVQLPERIRETLELVNEAVKGVAKELYKARDIFYIGRLGDLATACEGSLKMKEISYINSQAYAAGELKHGTISLIEQNTPVIAVAGEGRVISKTVSNMSEVSARGARVVGVTTPSRKGYMQGADVIICVSDVADELAGSLLVIPLQLLSYYTAKLRCCSIDKPKNLAKSVTVE
ncbi:MAG: glutamine--fructose-6-phosphate transaminase (isomerizing), partial [Clostridia bacterium]|nr:glutamine--fructose-6-phosphate transaminase (isomerizing) [Clostridia bacterium]